MSKYTDLTNRKYGMLRVIKQARRRNGNIQWKCLCDCGKYKNLPTSQLNSGYTKSCGCATSRLKSEAGFKHGEGRSVTKEYRAWADMKHRCINPTSRTYKFYGGRGVTVCQRWIDSYEAFLSDVGRAPSKDHSLDRYPNKNGNYEPGNCRWATRLEQQNNIRSNVTIEYNGLSLTKAQWVRHLSITKSRLTYYLNKGYSMKEIEKLVS